MRKELLLLLTLLLPTNMLADGSKNVKQSVPKVTNIPHGLFSVRHSTRAEGSNKGVTATLKYEKIADMNTARAGHQLFPSGKGFVAVGGHTTGFSPTKTAEIWQDGSWRDLSIGSFHDVGFSVVLNDGRVMVGGGCSSDNGVGQSKNVDIYDPSTQTFSAGPNLTVARTMCNAIAIGNKVYVSGNWYADDTTLDYYDGSAFSAVGTMTGRSNPYLFRDAQSNVFSMGTSDTKGKAIPYATYLDGEKGLTADLYNVSTGITSTAATPYDDNLLPTTLPTDMRSADYHLQASEENFYFILAKLADNSEAQGFHNVLLLYVPEEDRTMIFDEFDIPSVHPETKDKINYRGGVYVNSARQEAYLIGASGDANNMTLHLISFNYGTNAWTIASASGFDFDVQSASWTMLPDGRFACTGGFVTSNSEPNKNAYIFTPTTAGENGSYTPTPEIGGRHLVVWLKSGDRVVYDLAESPVTTFSGTQLIIRTVKATASYERSTVLRYTYELVNTSISLQPGERRVQMDREGNGVTFRGLPIGTIARVYSVNGMMVEQIKVTDDQPLTVSLQNRPNGVYIIKAGTETIKLMKK